MRFRTPLNQVKGLGSAKGGTHHWWLQRLSAIALVPLSLWFIGSLIALTGAEHAEAVRWLGSPVATVLALAFIFAVFFHAQLGLQVVFEDYVHHEGIKLAVLILVKLTAALLALACAVAVLRIAFSPG